MNITIYTTPNCVQCRQSKVMLDKANVEYQTVDLSADAEAMQMVKDLGYTAAPVIVAEDKHWSGFRVDKLKDLIDKVKAEKK